jgi:WD40 repeat protein
MDVYFTSICLMILEEVLSLVKSPDGYAISGCSEGCVKFWDLKEKTNYLTLENIHASAVTAVTLVPSQNVLVTAAADGSIKWWDIKKQNNFHTQYDAH